MNKLFALIISSLFVIFALLTSASQHSKGYRVGDLVNNFELTNTMGEKTSLKNYPDSKGLIIVFTCNTCPYAQAYESRIQELSKKYTFLGFPLIAINSNDSELQPDDSMENMKKRAKRNEYDFPYLKDKYQSIAKMFGALKTPHVYLLYRKKLSQKFGVEYIGVIDDSPRDMDDITYKYVEEAITDILNGDSPKIKEKRAIGCSIKWKVEKN